MIFVGIDWAEAHHDVCVLDHAGEVLATRRIPDGLEGVARLHTLLAEHADEPEAVVVGIETDRGLLVGALLAAGYVVHAVNPLAASRYRERHGTSRAKSDRGDARMLADLVRTDRQHHRAVAPDSELLGAIKVLARSHQNLIWTRQRQTNALRNALREHARSQELNEGRIASDSERERWETRVAVSRAQLARARAELERARVTAPAAGLVLDVHARPGERIGPDGILELARVDRMYAIAEVYETDVGRVRTGQRARVTSRALPGPLSGRVEWIRPKVEKQDEIGTDPAARKDARVVEVKVLLEDSAAAAPFTNLQVEVEIEP